MLRTATGYLAVFACAATFPSNSLAQGSARVIDGEIVCPECSVELELIVTLGETDGPGVIRGEPKFVIRLPDGRFVTTEYSVAIRLLVFKPDGRFDQQVGRTGEGSPHFGDAHAAYLGPDNQLHVFDRFLRRESILNERFDVVDMTSIPQIGVHSIALGPDGHKYYNAVVNTPEAIGLPIHMVEGTRVSRSFGSYNPIQRPDGPEIGQRAMAAVPGGLWTARRTHYWLELWTPDGVRELAWERDVDWFKPYLMRDVVSPDNPLEPWITAIQPVGNGLLVVFVNVASETFGQNLRMLKRDDKVIYEVNDCHNDTDTIVEVIDLTRGRVVSSSRRDQCLYGFVQFDDGYGAYGYRLENGVPFIDVFRLHLPEGGLRR